MDNYVNIKMKNGKTIVVRYANQDDYESIDKFGEEFGNDPGAIQTMQYPGRPRPTKENFLKFIEKNCLIVAFDGDRAVGTCSVGMMREGHPYSGHAAGVGMMMLQDYTHNGIGGVFFDLGEKWAREHNVHKLQAEIRHNNIASIVNSIKHGFIITGIRYDAAFINGQYVHEYIIEKMLEK